MTGGAGAASPAGRAAAAAPVWFFDLDDTLHDASHRIYAAINARMTAYVATHLAIELEAASQVRQRYWRSYGATLLGMVRHHGVAPAHFLHYCHDFEVDGMLRSERGLAALLMRLPGRKVLLTNAPAHYAGRVLSGIGLHRRFLRRYAIEQMRVHGTLRPKPSRAMLLHVLAREKLSGRAAARRAVLVEDSPANLKAARALGMRTVLLDRHSRRLQPGRRLYVDHRVSTLMRLPGLFGRER